jgi:hypothetical protein
MVYDYGPKRLDKIRFLHIPKTGTTFAATVVHYGCRGLDDVFVDVLLRLNSKDPMPWKVDQSCKQHILVAKSRNGNWWAHAPFRKKIDSSFAVTILRKPSNRLGSQLIHMHSLQGRAIAFGIAYADLEPFIGVLRGKKKYLSAVDMREIVLASRMKYQQGQGLGSLDPSCGYKIQQRYTLWAIQVFNQTLVDCLEGKVIQDTFKDSWEQWNAQHFSTPISELLNGLDAKPPVNMRHVSLRQHGATARCKWIAAARYPGLLGCQVKMLLGRSCVEKCPLREMDVEKAKDVLENSLAFVGLQEKWDSSVHAFHAQFGGKLFEEELRVRRAGGRPKVKMMIEEQLNQHAQDLWDEPLYRFAERLFEIRKQNLTLYANAR